MRLAAILVAAGRGSRAGGGLAKQWRPLAGRSVAEWALKPFVEHPGIARVILVVPQDGMPDLTLPTGVETVHGSDTRQGSVCAGLEALKDTADRVLIHDAARPFARRELLDQVIAALDEAPAAAPALPLVDALWRGEQGRVLEAAPRDGLWRAQTPQGFHLAAILAAHRAHPGGAADDVEIAIAAGLEVRIVPGGERNFKLTTQDDFLHAENVLRLEAQETRMDVRLGNGYDVHRFGPGDHVWLCGVRIVHQRGLQGHSDADVGMHAVTDALYGALAAGDIGRHFPPSDPQWKGAASHIFLAHACALVREGGWQIANVDVTLVCEHPKIGPHASEMQKEMSRIMEIETDRISVKATTSERLGFTGREEGIAAFATAALIRP